ncbi:Rhodanese-like domain-containing protein [Umbelopsis sp. PMI_123]|nr:Rhodanese-like domain-containing protein [Umbelopsis sp. PMI_123]
MLFRATMSSFTAPLVHDTEILQLLRNKSKIPKKDYVIIDVRDHDFAGGNIPGAVNVPSRHFIENVQNIIEDYKDVPQVFFHCALSQSRGPKAARIYNESKSLQGVKSNQQVCV